MPELQTIPVEDAKLPLPHLQLTLRAERACESKGCRTIAEVEQALDSRILSCATVGKKSHAEIQAAVAEVNELRDTEGRIDWDKVWEKRGIALSRLAMSSRALARAATGVRGKGLGSLHLGKACAKLQASGISTVGDLIDAARIGIGGLPNFGKVAQHEVIAALSALSKSIRSDGTPDWECYALARGFPLLPVEGATNGNAPELLKSFPALCKMVVSAQFNERAWQIFNRRYLVPERTVETLDQIGIVYGVTRERVRQIEESCLNALRKPILEDDYCGLEFRLREGTVSLFRNARSHFKSLELPAWSESCWLSDLAALWQVSEHALRRYDRLIVSALGFQWRNTEKAVLEPLIMDESASKPDAEQLIKAIVAIHEALRANCQGLDSFGLVRALKSEGIEVFGLDDVPMLVDLCSTAEVVESESNLVCTKFEFLQGRPNQAVRVLHEVGSALHHRDLLREINRRLPESKRVENKENLVNQLAPDGRLHPIGKSGNWALTEWGVESRSLIDIIEDILASTGEAMDQEEIGKRVLEKRPGSSSSIPMILSLNRDRFRKIARRIYGLAAWGDQVVGGAISDESVAKFVEAHIESSGGRSVDFKELRKAFEESVGLSSHSAAGVLAAHPAVEITMENSYQRKVSYRKDWRKNPVQRSHQRSAPLQCQRIVDEAKQLIMAAPSGELRLSEVVERLEIKTGIRRANLYAAIGQADEIEKSAIEGTAFKKLHMRSGPDRRIHGGRTE